MILFIFCILFSNFFFSISLLYFYSKFFKFILEIYYIIKNYVIILILVYFLYLQIFSFNFYLISLSYLSLIFNLDSLPHSSIHSQVPRFYQILLEWRVDKRRKKKKRWKFYEEISNNDSTSSTKTINCAISSPLIVCVSPLCDSLS